MPMFYTPKPRQFHYKPRFYDPEKEEWEKLKAKYRLKRGMPLDGKGSADAVNETSESEDKDLAYFQRRVREEERKDRVRKQQLTISDLFRKREKPEFHYVSRFDSEGNLIETPAESTKDKAIKKRITRRFDNEDDMDRFKPIPAGKIMIYTLIVFLLFVFIFF